MDRSYEDLLEEFTDEMLLKFKLYGTVENEGMLQHAILDSFEKVWYATYDYWLIEREGD